MQKKWQVQYMPIAEIKPYEKNPRKNDYAVDSVAASIKEFGWQQPIVVDKDRIIIVGHTRYKAAQKLEQTEVPVVIADWLNDEQVKAYRLADNKTNELSEWDYALLDSELLEIENIDMKAFGFGTNGLSVEDENSEIESKVKSPVAVKITFKNAAHWRQNEDALRKFVDELQDVKVVVGEFEDED